MILGPAPCSLCHRHVFFNGHMWCDQDGNKHRCPRVMEDAELGQVRLCRRCAEYWPDDSEFWWVNKHGRRVCWACQRTWNRQSKERRCPGPTRPRTGLARTWRPTVAA